MCLFKSSGLCFTIRQYGLIMAIPLLPNHLYMTCTWHMTCSIPNHIRLPSHHLTPCSVAQPSPSTVLGAVSGGELPGHRRRAPPLLLRAAGHLRHQRAGEGEADRVQLRTGPGRAVHLLQPAPPHSTGGQGAPGVQGLHSIVTLLMIAHVMIFIQICVFLSTHSRHDASHLWYCCVHPQWTFFSCRQTLWIQCIWSRASSLHTHKCTSHYFLQKPVWRNFERG